MKKTLLLLLLLGVALVGAYIFSECSKVSQFDQERTYVFYFTEIVFNDEYDKSLILDGKTEQQYIDTYAGLKQTKFIFKPDGNMYAPKEGTVNYAYYYEVKEGVITVYYSKGGEKFMTFNISGSQIKARLYYFESIGSGKSYFDATFVLF